MFQNTWVTSGFTCHWLAKAGSSVTHLLGSLWCPCWLPGSGLARGGTTQSMGGGFIFCPGAGPLRVLPLRGPRWSVTSGLCYAGYLLRGTQVVRVGRQEGRNPPGSVTFVQTGVLRPKPREPLWGLGTTHRNIKSAQPTCSFLCDLKSQVTRNERDTCHVDLAEWKAERAGSRLLNRMLSPEFSLSLPREGRSPRSCDKCQCAISIGGGWGAFFLLINMMRSESQAASWRPRLLQRGHADPACGHPGIDTTMTRPAGRDGQQTDDKAAAECSGSAAMCSQEPGRLLHHLCL